MSVALNNSNTDAQATAASVLSASMSVTAGGSNVCAVAHITAGNTSGTWDVSAVTYNSVGMTAAGAVDVQSQGFAKSYVLAAPSTGSNTLAVTISGGSQATIYAALVSYTGVNQTTPVRAGSYAQLSSSASSATAALTINSAIGDMTTTCVSAANGAAAISSTDKTERNRDNTGTTCFGSDDAAGAATVTHTWTFGAANATRVMVGFSLMQYVAPLASLFSYGAGRSGKRRNWDKGGWFNTRGHAKGWFYRLWVPSASVVATITGTATASITEADVVAGGKTIIITLTGDTWIAAGALSFDLQRANIIQGLDSAQSEALGWNLQVRDTEVVTAVVRTSDTVVTITLSASAAYNITAPETITVTVPATAVTGAQAVIATPTFGVSVTGAAAFIGARMNSYPRLGLR